MIDVIIREIHDVASGIRSFVLAKEDGQPLPPFGPGAHIDVHLPGTMTRQYSLCGEADRTDSYMIAVLKATESRGGSHAMHGLKEGDHLAVDGPRNHFALVEEADHSVLIAGGIGVTPLLTMAEHLAATNQSFELHYCVRSLPTAAFLKRLQSAVPGDRFCLYCDDAKPPGAIDFALVCRAPIPGKHLYVCGPSGFMEAALNAARQAGWAEKNLHREYFAAAPSEGIAAGGFRVKLARSGRSLEVGPDQSVVEALAANGVVVPVSCEQGICGTCVTRVLAGELEHHDHFLTNAERERGDQFTPCCSRAKSAELVLDL